MGKIDTDRRSSICSAISLRHSLREIMPHPNDGQLVAPVVDFERRRVTPMRIVWTGGVIETIDPVDQDHDDWIDGVVTPGFIDSHIHIESSMLTPSRFAAAAIPHGTVATVSDPHEIANVCGVDGVRFMLDDARQSPLKCFFGAPSCVPATTLETAGDSIDAGQIASLLDHPEVLYLAEMMNWPGVLQRDPAVMTKIQSAIDRGLPVDGHAPSLAGQMAKDYFAAGITADHECATIDEAIQRIELGVIVQIREGSAARNFDALWPLIDRYPGRVALCSDDKHPDELLVGHINALCRRAVALGCDVYNVLTAACLVPIQHYRLPVGRLRVGDPADFVVLSDLETFEVRQTYIDGVCQFSSRQGDAPERPAEPTEPITAINRFAIGPKSIEDFRIQSNGKPNVRVIVAHDGLLTTTQTIQPGATIDGRSVGDVTTDRLKITVVNRYAEQPPAMAWVRGFGLTSGALASSVAHDSHNIIAVAADDDALLAAVNAVIDHRGGLSAVDAAGNVDVLPLPVAGLMSDRSCREVAEDYQRLDRTVKMLGCPLRSPYMTLSFLALLVIPAIKLSDKGLFDAENFQFLDLQI